MSFETIDWELEARRVALAFGVKEECEFLDYGEGRRGLWGVWNGWEVSLAPEISMIAVYSSQYREYAVGWPDCHGASYVYIFWDGREPIVEVSEYLRNVMADGLLCLNLLSAELEEKLGITLSAHEKLERQLEFEQKVQEKSWVQNWYTASAIKQAFGFEGEAEFKEMGGGLQVLEAILPDGTRLRVEDLEQVAWFSLQKGERATTIGMDWYGSVFQEPVQFDYAEQMAKALKILAYLSDSTDIEKALKVGEYTES